jgi:ADP-heptose:LPS heptosyltransferase
MQAFGNILIFHPAAIGDAMLATPVAKTLRLNFPKAKITYWSHPSLRQLIVGLCPSVDEFVDFSRDDGLLALRKIFSALEPDLFVDLSNSNRARLFTLFSNARVVRYVKRPQSERPIMHAVDNFMQVVSSVCPEVPETLFPTVFPNVSLAEILAAVGGAELKKPIIGIVPGVGKSRAHRAWVYDGWLFLLKLLQTRGTHNVVLIGGEDEAVLCDQLKTESETDCLNLAGRLTLTQTAAVLKSCQVVITGDTGPAHIANAVGTPVIALHGPTFSARSGPFDYLALALDESDNCRCIDLKACRFTTPGQSGECMGRIGLPDLMEKLDAVLANKGKMKSEQPGVSVD